MNASTSGEATAGSAIERAAHRCRNMRGLGGRTAVADRFSMVVTLAITACTVGPACGTSPVSVSKSTAEDAHRRRPARNSCTATGQRTGDADRDAHRILVGQLLLVPQSFVQARAV